MEVFFLDVAQGTAQVILLGQRRAIVIDGGIRLDRIVLQFLRRMGVEFLERLIVSHSHEDHLGGAVAVLGDYQDRIGRICFVQDHNFLQSDFWRRISTLYQEGRLSSDQLVRLECADRPHEVWTDHSRTFRLRTYSPSAVENLRAQQTGQPNPTSAVLFLDARGDTIVFAADSGIDQWREIRLRSGRRIPCRVLSVPHHAGRFHATQSDLDWLFDEALDVDAAVISVGTSNTFGHPRPDVISAMARRNVKVLCTQITRRCHHDPESLRPGVLQPQRHIGRSSSFREVTPAGKSRNVACAGTIRVAFTGTEWFVEGMDDHRKAVDRLSLAPGGCPLCRTTKAT